MSCKTKQFPHLTEAALGAQRVTSGPRLVLIPRQDKNKPPSSPQCRRPAHPERESFLPPGEGHGMQSPQNLCLSRSPGSWRPVGQEYCALSTQKSPTQPKTVFTSHLTLWPLEHSGLLPNENAWELCPLI